MATRWQFSDAQWARVRALPDLVIRAACMSDGKSPPAVRELAAGGETMTEAIKRYPDNAFLQYLQSLRDDTLYVLSKAGKDDSAAAKVENVAEAVELMAKEIEAGVAAVRTHVSTEEFAQFGEVLLDSARAVVERLGDGLLGGGKEKVSKSEQALGRPAAG
jgi:hypothetical protein